MNPSRLFILRPVATSLLMIAILIAGALALGYDVDGVVGIYRRLAPEVFQRPRWFSGVRSRFDAGAFETAVPYTFSRKQFGQVIARLLRYALPGNSAAYAPPLASR